MYYERFNDYTKEYKSGVSKITTTTTYIKLNKDLLLVEERHRDNYTIIFSQSGLLSSVFEYHYQNNKLKSATQYIYTYDHEKKISFILGIDVVKRLLSHKIEFFYNSDGQIAEEYYYSYHNGNMLTGEYICTHSYKDNCHIMEHLECDEDREHIFETRYDSETGTVDEKVFEEEDQCIFWNRKVYSKSGRLTRELFLEENGELYAETEYFYETNKEVSIKYDKENTYYETVIENDPANHRTQKNYFRNGMLYCVEEKIMEFFKK